MVTMADLSPASRTVLEALREAGRNWANDGKATFQDIASAVLRAAADQVVPEQEPWHRTSDANVAKHEVRLEFLAIANELDGIAKTGT
jgi:hypothetical protein